jgi:hypothetical protein
MASVTIFAEVNAVIGRIPRPDGGLIQVSAETAPPIGHFLRSQTILGEFAYSALAYA